MIRLLSFLCICIITGSLSHAGNDILNRRISLKVSKITMPEILREIEKKAEVTFNYNQKILPEGKFSLQVKNEELDVVLVKLLNPHKLSFSVLYGNFIVINSIPKGVRQFTVSGYVINERSGEKIIGANIYSRNTLQSCNSDQDGFYSLTLNADSVHLVYSMSGYESRTISLLLNKNITQNISLNDAQEYRKVYITSKPDHQTNYRPDEFHFNGTTLKQLPVLFGESDVMKGLQLLPGVSSGNDGTIGLNIRGGGPDQNLILLDDVPLYNPSHIYGFFSVFNSDVVKDVRLIKGGTSSRYSGRLSSVIDVRTLDGNTKKIKFQTSIGLLSSKLAIDGPIDKKGKTTFMLAGRRSYIDLLSSAFGNNLLGSNSPLRSGYFFYDANGKINHKINDKHKLSFSFYTGMDNSFIKNSFRYKDPGKSIKEKDVQTIFWGNRIFSFRDHHVLHPKLSAWFNLAFTSYNFGNESGYEYSESTDSIKNENAYNYKFISSIRNTMVSYNIEYRPKNIVSLKAGIAYNYQIFAREINSSDNIISNQISNSSSIRTGEYSTYADVQWKPKRNLIINTGLNYSAYTIGNKTYDYLQPRLSANYKPNKHLLLHVGYQKMVQFLHLLTSNTAGMPLDLWLPSTVDTKPETSDLWSGGISYYKGDFVFNVEAFSRKMYDIIEYKDQSNYLGSDNEWENKITSGKGRAHGYEFLAEKRNGKTKGWVSYTWSWNYRQFDLINGGKEFPYKYDRRHNIAILVNHHFSTKVDASFNWVFSTGANYTLPEQVYYTGNGLDPKNTIYIYGDRNNYKFPNYHRLDFSVNFKKYGKRHTRIVSIGAYNLYNRMNPFYINPAYSQDGKRIFEAVSLFPVLPSINYKISF